MKRIVNRTLIDAWLSERYPDAVTKLATASKVPANSINKIRTGWVPKNSEKRESLAKAIGVSERELFPVKPDGESGAA